ncbi:MAG: sulfatase-like hydrolase/transferase [bacterium]|nr:sulfatase-like hydrolase/transferase [bacterium]
MALSFSASNPAEMPNVLLIITDQHRADCLGCYGNGRIDTPNIDRIAREGVRVDRAYVTNPLCTPSRASILTGQSVSGHGAWNLGVPLPEGTRTLPEALAECGYRTGAIGKVHLTPQVAGCPEFPENEDFWNRDPEPEWRGPYFGFEWVDLFVGHQKLIGHYGQYIKHRFPDLVDRYDRRYALDVPTGAPHSWKCGFPLAHHSCTWICERTLDFLRRQDERPFFVQCSFPFPHFPFAPPSPYCDQYDPNAMELPEQREGDLEGKPSHVMDYFRAKGGEGPLCEVTDAQKREIVAHTYGMIGLVDDLVGRILDTLDELAVTDNTIVVFCSDHGELLFDHGLLKKGPYLYEGLVRVPLLWRWPEGLPRGRTVDGLFSLADLAPTVLEMLGMNAWPEIEGRSQVPVLRGEAQSVRDAALVEYYHGRRTARDGMRLKALVMDQWKLIHYPGELYGELYDLEADPGEFENRFDHPEDAGVRDRLMARLQDEWVERDESFGPRLSSA